MGAHQCTNKPLQDNPFCKRHQDPNLRMKHGMQGNLLNPLELERRLRAALKHETQDKLTWYSRAYMWQEADKLKLNSVDEMTDDQYTEALRNTHMYYNKHPAQRHQFKLEAGMGPQTLDDRHTEKERYVGEVHLHKYYSRPLFAHVLKSIANGKTIHEATEK